MKPEKTPEKAGTKTLRPPLPKTLENTTPYSALHFMKKELMLTIRL
jgi:hypothetical protein